MQRIMNLGVLMALHQRRSHRPLKNCKFELVYVYSSFTSLYLYESMKERCRASLKLTLLLLISFSTECQMVMNVLWTRLTETGKDWRYVYKVRFLLLPHFSFLGIINCKQNTCSLNLGGLMGLLSCRQHLKNRLYIRHWPSSSIWSHMDLNVQLMKLQNILSKSL